jgi:membrane-bound lytic murein transglycosylase B
MSQKKVFVDLKKKNTQLDVSSMSHRVNLRAARTIEIPLKKIIKYGIVSVVVLTFVFGFANAPINRGYSLAATSKETERSQLEAQLRDIEKQIAEYESTVTEYKKQGNTLQSEIKNINAKIAKLNLQIKAITLNLQKLNREIDSTKVQITSTEGQISTHKEQLSALLENLYESDRKNAIELIMANPKFSDFFLDVNNLLAMQDSVRTTLDKVVELKNNLVDQKESLAMAYEDADQLRKYQEAQQTAAKKIETDKQVLLKVTKGQESKYQQLLTEKRKTAAQIRSRIYELIGGGELTFGDAYKYAKIAQDATGVRAALILAVLDRESALGRNVGKCVYNKNPYYPDQADNPTTMHPTRDIPVFLKITAELGLNPENVFVSCPIPRDGAYGGGMGPAQFIPSTWVGYKDRIASLTGNSPANPWNNMDAFMATALYMKDKGAAGGSLYDEKVAAAKYYAGGNWQKFVSSYGARVVERAQEFQEDIDVLNS